MANNILNLKKLKKEDKKEGIKQKTSQRKFKFPKLDREKLKIFLLILTPLILIGALFYFRYLFYSFYSAQLKEIKTKLEKCQKSLTEETEKISYDKVRMSDASNILLAIQEYYFEKRHLPPSLSDLKTEGYLGGEANLTDPETGKPYYYKIEDDKFTLCIYLSTGVWGMSTDRCPSREE